MTTEEYYKLMSQGLGSQGIANKEYKYNQKDSSGMLNRDNRTDGTLYKQGDDTMVSGTLWDSKAGMDDYIKAGDFTGAEDAGFGGGETAFKLQNAQANKSIDWGMTGMSGVALGAGQLGLGVMSYLENSKTADKQRALMDQQIANNKFSLGNAKDFKEAVNKTFGDRVSLNKTSDSKGE